MLAGMGGVSYHRLVAAVSEAGGFGCLGASTMGDDEMVDEIAAVRAPPTSRSASTCSPPLPGDMEAKVQRHHRRRRHRVRRRARRAPRRRRPVPRQQRAGREHVRQGPPRDRRGRGRLRHRRRPGHRGRRPHRAGRHAWRWSPRSSTRSATGCRWWPPAASSTGGAWPPRSPSAPTACGSAPASSPPPRPAASPGYKDALLRMPRGRHGRHPGLHRQDVPGRSRNRYTADFEDGTAASSSRSRPRSCGRCRTAPTTSAATSDARGRPRPRVHARRPGRRRHRRAGAGGRARPPVRGRGRGACSAKLRSLTRAGRAARQACVGPVLELLDRARGRRPPIGVTLSTVTPAALKAAMRSRDVALGAAERGRLEELVGHGGRGLVLLAVEVEVLDLLGLGLVAVAAGQVVVEVAAPGAHAADVEGDHRAGAGRGSCAASSPMASRPPATISSGPRSADARWRRRRARSSPHTSSAFSGR